MGEKESDLCRESDLVTRLRAGDPVQESFMAAFTSIEKFPETYRTVLLLRDIEELETQAAARLLGISGNAVKVRLHRARQALRGLLDPQLGG